MTNPLPPKIEKGARSSGKRSTHSKLCSYYLECISKDFGDSISLYASSVHSLEYTQLSTFPTGSVQPQIDKHLVEKVRKDRNNLTFKFGYPVLFKKGAGKVASMIQPLFLFSVDVDLGLNSASIRLTGEDPAINHEAIKSLTGLDSNSEILQEVSELYDHWDLNSRNAETSTLEYLILRFQEFRKLWPWEEKLSIDRLTEEPLSGLQNFGIYNKAITFVGTKSKYTAGLEKDLRELAQLPEATINGSMLGAWINNSVAEIARKNKVILEPIPLNNEQREAVLAGLSSPITVVTGPPGTGKSQVVANLIINAIHDGQTVLFASKNNKAVDVVYERVNQFSPRPALLRLGSSFQSSLTDYLSTLLSSKTSGLDQANYQEAAAAHQKLSSRITELQLQEEKFIKLRNELDQLEISLEPIRERLEPAVFEAFRNFQEIDFEAISTASNDFKNIITKADRRKQGNISKVFWPFIRQRRFSLVGTQASRLFPLLDRLRATRPALPIGDDTITKYEHYHDLLLQRYTDARQVYMYFAKLNALANTSDLFEISAIEKQVLERLAENSLLLWQMWLQLLPNKLNQKDRKIIGDYIAVLSVITSSPNAVPREIWSKYYDLAPQMLHILPGWSVTSLSVRRQVPLEPGFFDLLVIDEASQCDIASALPLLYRAKRVVIIGDDKQLTHISAVSETQDFKLLQKYDLSDDYLAWSYSVNSLFRLACTRAQGDSIIKLLDHHRSHGEIIGYSNGAFYENSLRVATKYESLKLISGEPAVRWIDVQGECYYPSTGSVYNDKEADTVITELRRLVSNGYQGTVGVVTPFRAQYLRILDKAKIDPDLFDRLIVRDFLCDTVHKFQGDERDVIIFSSVVSKSLGEGSRNFLKRNGNLFNVAITRARAALIIIGDRKGCYNSDILHYRKFVEYVAVLDDRRGEENRNPQRQDFGPKYPLIMKQVSISHWEKRLYEALYAAGIATCPQVAVDKYSLDLALYCGDRKLNIEVDGEMYHRNWDGESVRSDQLRNKRLMELGWDVQRFWVYQVRDNMPECIERIRMWLLRREDLA